VTTVGSWPRPSSVTEAMRAYRQRRIGRAERDRAADDAVVEFLRLQETLGCDIVTDGELRRDNFYSFVADKLSGVRLMTLAEMLEVVEDKAGFEQLLQTLDVPAYSISSPICTARIQRREPLAVDDLTFARLHTDLPIKVTLPGPYLLTRAMFVPELTRACYADKEALARDVVALLRAELEELRSAGVEFVQFDEPVLTEVAFAPGRTRTFMCAALAARRDPAEELEFAVSLINEVVAGVDDLRLGLHVCRGNWSRDESVALTGPYTRLVPLLATLPVGTLFLETTTPRAGELDALTDLPPAVRVGLGVVNQKLDRVETVEEIVGRAEAAVAIFGPDRVWLNPDCGFATFADNPLASARVAEAKLAAIVQAARVLRERYGNKE
jgi:5-methyltetrahydropteroyltriglutamate--homocysteine methyltransferase